MGLLKIDNVVHWSIPVNDLAESEKFYRDVLGLTYRGRLGNSCMSCFTVGAHSILLCARKDRIVRTPEQGNRLHHSFAVSPARFAKAQPNARVIDLGVGDVTRPLPPAAVRALHEAADDMARPETFKGYGPYVGYEWLRAEIAAQDFGTRGVTIAPDEVFISDGGKSDSANLQEIFARDAVVAVMDPVYPVYADANVVAGRTGAADESGRYAGMVYLPVVAENRFQPALPDRPVDLIYLCYPNNPTGAVATREALTRWVDYARAHQAVILYDAAYEAYIVDEDVPHSIYELEGAKDVAVECRSLSKNAGFTGMRMAYTVVPKQLL